MHYEVSHRYRSKTEKVYAGRTEKFTEQELKDKIKEKWDEISVAEIHKSVSSWKKWFRLVDSVDRDYINH